MNGLYHFLKGKGLLVASLVGLTLTIVFFAIMVAGVPDVSHLATDKEKREALYPVASFDPFLYINEFLVIFAFFVVLPAGAALGVFRNPKASLFGLIGVVVVVVLFAIFYASASGEMTPSGIKMGLTAGNMKIVDACIYISYLFIGASIAVPVGMSIFGAIKNR